MDTPVYIPQIRQKEVAPNLLPMSQTQNNLHRGRKEKKRWNIRSLERPSKYHNVHFKQKQFVIKNVSKI